MMQLVPAVTLCFVTVVALLVGYALGRFDNMTPKV